MLTKEALTRQLQGMRTEETMILCQVTVGNIYFKNIKYQSLVLFRYMLEAAQNMLGHFGHRHCFCNSNRSGHCSFNPAGLWGFRRSSKHFLCDDNAWRVWDYSDVSDTNARFTLQRGTAPGVQGGRKIRKSKRIGCNISVVELPPHGPRYSQQGEHVQRQDGVVLGITWGARRIGAGTLGAGQHWR